MKAPTAKPSVTAPPRRNMRMRSSGPEESVARILDATLDAIASKGLRQLSMSEVCRVAGVARGTLYRYFPTSEALLKAIAEGVGLRFEAEMTAYVRPGHTDPLECLYDVADFLGEYAVRTRTEAMLQVEPLFVLDFLTGQVEHYSRVMSKVLAPVFDAADAQTGRKVDRLLWSQMLLRIDISLYLLPPTVGEAKAIMRRYFKALLPALFAGEPPVPGPVANRATKPPAKPAATRATRASAGKPGLR